MTEIKFKLYLQHIRKRCHLMPQISVDTEKSEQIILISDGQECEMGQFHLRTFSSQK